MCEDSKSECGSLFITLSDKNKQGRTGCTGRRNLVFDSSVYSFHPVYPVHPCLNLLLYCVGGGAGFFARCGARSTWLGGLTVNSKQKENRPRFKFFRCCFQYISRRYQLIYQRALLVGQRGLSVGQNALLEKQELLPSESEHLPEQLLSLPN
jgi:hypothetical protein